ncbi:FeoA family protein [Paludicola sp. MB14-C6]|uniref:FeoA family protein n=1 Tax=Paludihabitans sp. MB14-C6 TaxID=3070656 RepID=UPI0027DC3B04|nr:FeoA family protein [Paludicola sp. MB14-C6]WMJ23821.1 FeoA family protein [Paludicola sp. MB14-C6]
MATLKNLRPGEKGIVTQIETKGALKRRLIDMGITPGVEIMVRKVAPLGDPIEINLRGYELTIRNTEAHSIHIIKNDKK